MRTLMLWVSCVLFTATTAMGAPGSRPQIRWERYTVKDWDGHEGTWDLGRLAVPEDHQHASSRQIDLAFIRLESTASQPGPPIVFLSGGPGQAATPLVRNPGVLASLEPLRAVADVILLDQRGTGQSKPELACDSDAAAPLDLFSDRPGALDFFVREAKACADRFRTEGVDVAAYNTRQSADDIEDLRRALGVDKVSLLGFSYGTHLATAAIRQHGDHLARVVLIGTEGPDHTWKLPSTMEMQLEKLSLMVAEDPTVAKQVPDFAAMTRRVLARAATKPYVVSLESKDGDTFRVPIGREGLRRILLWDIGDGNDLPWFPDLIYQLDQGRTDTLKWFVRKRYRQMGSGVSLMSLAMDCASGVSRARRARIEAEAKTATFGNVMNGAYESVCPVIEVPQLDDTFRAPIHSPVDTLFVSGTLDANTPPYQAEEIRWGMPNAKHLIVVNAGHEDMLPDPRVQQAIVTFFAEGELPVGRVVLRRPEFVPVDRVRE